jgi:hypothetical protein
MVEGPVTYGFTLHLRVHDRTKVEGAKTNTPSKTNTYKCLPNANILRPWTVPDNDRGAFGHNQLKP